MKQIALTIILLFSFAITKIISIKSSSKRVISPSIKSNYNPNKPWGRPYGNKQENLKTFSSKLVPKYMKTSKSSYIKYNLKHPRDYNNDYLLSCETKRRMGLNCDEDE